MICLDGSNIGSDGLKNIYKLSPRHLGKVKADEAAGIRYLSFLSANMALSVLEYKIYLQFFFV